MFLSRNTREASETMQLKGIWNRTQDNVSYVGTNRFISNKISRFMIAVIIIIIVLTKIIITFLKH